MPDNHEKTTPHSRIAQAIPVFMFLGGTALAVSAFVNRDIYSGAGAAAAFFGYLQTTSPREK